MTSASEDQQPQSEGAQPGEQQRENSPRDGSGPRAEQQGGGQQGSEWRSEASPEGAGAPGSERSQPFAPPPGGPHEYAFFRWIRSLGLVRGDERWLAGVCGAIAARTGLDPIIVRGIAIVVGILGGPLMLLYLAGWVLLPGRDGEIIAERVIQGRADGWTIALVIAICLLAFGGFALIPSVWDGTFGWKSTWGFGGILFWGLVIVLLLGWRRRKDRRNDAGGWGGPGRQPGPGYVPPTGAPAAAAAGAGTSASAAAQGAQPFAEPRTEESDTPASASAETTFGGYGAASTGQGAPISAPYVGSGYGGYGAQASTGYPIYAAPKPKKRENRAPAGVVLAAVGAVLVAGALAGGAWFVSAGGLGWYPGALAVGLSVVVLLSGMAMVVFGIVGWRGGGLGVVALFCSLLLAVVAVTPRLPSDIVAGSSQSLSAAGTIQNVLVVAGRATVDLSRLATGDTATVTVLAGEADIEVPNHGQYEVNSRVGMGSVQVVGSDSAAENGGIIVTRTYIIDNGAVVGALDSDLPVTTVNVSVALGSARLSIGTGTEGNAG